MYDGENDQIIAVVKQTIQKKQRKLAKIDLLPCCRDYVENLRSFHDPSRAFP
jgi:hypothetical protein